MSEKDKLMENLIEKSTIPKEKIEQLVTDKINELSGLVSAEGAIYIIANELGVRLDSERPKKEVELKKIAEITEPKTPVSLVCKVIKKYDRVTFSSGGSDGSVQSLLVGDESGITRVVFWHDKTDILENIHEGDILKIINAYTRENNQNPGRIEIHYGQYSDIEVNPKDIKVEVQEFNTANFEFLSKKVSELEEGDKNVKVSAIVTDFDIPRFYFACPDCFKKVYQDDGVQKCAEHNEVSAMRIPIINFIVDDGTGSLSIVGFRDRAENFTGVKSEEIIRFTEDIDKYKDFSRKIIGSKVEIAGNIGINNMTGEKQLMMNQVIEVKFKSVDEIAKELVNEDKKEKIPAKKKNLTNEFSDDDLDLDIEEIDVDDDLL